jgi:predicted Fe-Mo cluster-binding NifX family protein
MKIAVSSLGENLDAPYDYRFKQAPHVLILDSKNLQYKELSIQQKRVSERDLARTLIDNGVNAVVTGKCSDPVSDMLIDAHIRLYDGKEGTVKDNLRAIYKHDLLLKFTDHYTIEESGNACPMDPDRAEIWEIIPGHIPE